MQLEPLRCGGYLMNAVHVQQFTQSLSFRVTPFSFWGPSGICHHSNSTSALSFYFNLKCMLIRSLLKSKLFINLHLYNFYTEEKLQVILFLMLTEATNSDPGGSVSAASPGKQRRGFSGWVPSIRCSHIVYELACNQLSHESWKRDGKVCYLLLNV